ncbi:DUF6402 family protein [Enterobacter roggenkampii]|uniref:DUF6402 family protein n=1 Tax=Enterobacter roggenkampii TaxID=1812935 RepID=UPI0038998F6F
MAPKLMEHWFEISPAFIFTTESKRKTLDEDARNLPSTQVSTEIVKMSWALKFGQVSAGIEELNGRWKSMKGIARLKKLLQIKVILIKVRYLLGILTMLWNWITHPK